MQPEDDPLYVGLMEGPNAPMALAFLWCGWKSKVFEVKPHIFGPSADLLDSSVQDEVRQAVMGCQALGWGMGCKTMSAALNIPDPDVPEAVPPQVEAASDGPSGIAR